MRKLLCTVLSLCMLLPICLSGAMAETEATTIDYFSYFVVAMQDHYYEAFSNVRDELTLQEVFAGMLLNDGISMITESSTDMQYLLLDLSSTSVEDVRALINGGFIDVDHPGCEPMDDVLVRLAEIFEEKGLEMPKFYYIQHFDVGSYNREEGWQCFLGHLEADVGQNSPIVDYEVYLSGDGMTLANFVAESEDF